MPAGRPSSYSDEIAQELCDRLASSDFGLEEVCEADDMPGARTVHTWVASNEEFRQKYAQAREAQGHTLAERGMREALTATDASLGRLKFDARKWAASKLAPKVYGDRITHQGDSEADPIKSALTVRFE